MLRATVLAALSVVAACGGEPSATPSAAPDAPRITAPRIAVIPKGTTHVFWQAVAQGAKEAGTATGLDVVWKGPLQENDRAQQIQLVQQFVGDGVAGIALAPLDHAALAPAVAAAKARNIPVVIFDSDLDGKAGEDFASFVATDNRKGGADAAAHLAGLLGGKGKVVVLRYQVGSASTEAREAGFLAAAKAAGLEVLVDNRYAGATIGDAKNTALNLADQLRQAQGVFCSMPAVAPMVDTGAVLATKANMDEPAVQRLLQ